MAYELVGDDYDDLLGLETDDDFSDGGLIGDDYEILGATRMRTPVARRVLTRTKYTRERGLALGFGSQSVAAAATSDFTANPQVPFRPKRVIVQSTSGIGDFIIEDIRVGKNSQFASAAGFPGSAFVNDAFDIGVKFDSASPGIDIVITITNNNAGAQTITAGMFGYAAER